MPTSTRKTGKKYGARCEPINLSKHFNAPPSRSKDDWHKALAARIAKYPKGTQRSWGIPFRMSAGKAPRVILVADGMQEVTIPVRRSASFLCILHEWPQRPDDIHTEDPTEGLVVGEYVLAYEDGTRRVTPVRARFEVPMAESPAPPWLAVPFHMWGAVDPVAPPQGQPWGHLQPGLRNTQGAPYLYAMPNPRPSKRIRSLTIRGRHSSPLLVAAITAYRGAGHPLAHLPRRTYRVRAPGGPVKVANAEVDLGGVARIERTAGPRGKAWLQSPVTGTTVSDPDRGAEDLIEAFGAADATLTVTPEGKKRALTFSLGEAFANGKSASGKAALQVLGRKRQWMRVRVIDKSTGKPTPVRIHFSGPRGEYIAPYAHHAQVNTNWFEDYGADCVAANRNFAYVHGEFPTDLPVGDLYVEIYKGFEYEAVRRKVTVRPGQEVLELEIGRWTDLRSKGWVTADTHVHFISPHTAWLEAQAEGVNVVNLLASQWGRLFTNVGDFTGRVGVVENDTIVYVGTENRNHMLGHMSMLGTQGLPVYPMCCGGPSESWVGDPDFLALADWARYNKTRGGVVIRPHFPYCGHTEDPVPILAGLVDALEIRVGGAEDFPIQEWYRYLNCGYRVAVAGGTDKMSAGMILGGLRTYAKLPPDRPFSYDSWGEAVRAGRTFASTGPLLDLTVDGSPIGGTIDMSESGGTVEIDAVAQSFWPMRALEIVYNGRVVSRHEAPKGERNLRVQDTLPVPQSGWIAARCWGGPAHPSSYMGAHTSPVYIRCGNSRIFSGPAAEHMLALVEGGIEYLQTLSTAFDESTRRRLVKLYQEAQHELHGRLSNEAGHVHHHGKGGYHTHGHGAVPDHKH